ncbi:MAG: transcriptional repressor [Halioglobus sp.]|nr:transcriptional repressor [Halioglobus sp.]
MSRQEIREKLEACGVLPTPQRMEVAEILLDKPQHLAADQIIDVLRQGGCRVSKATVYNTLNLFSERGLVREVNVDTSRRFYDSTTHPHHHFFHVETGELQDIPHDRISIAGLPPLPAGTERESIEVMIRVKNKNRHA